MGKTKGRPKGELKQKITLSISPEKLEKGRKTAQHLNKSLSKFTEDIYVDIHNNFFESQSTPEQRLKKIEKQIQEFKELDKLKNGKNKSNKISI